MISLKQNQRSFCICNLIKTEKNQYTLHNATSIASLRKTLKNSWNTEILPNAIKQEDPSSRWKSLGCKLEKNRTLHWRNVVMYLLCILSHASIKGHGWIISRGHGAQQDLFLTSYISLMWFKELANLTLKSEEYPSFHTTAPWPFFPNKFIPLQDHFSPELARVSLIWRKFYSTISWTSKPTQKASNK